MEQAMPVVAVEPEHIVEIVVYVNESLEEEERLNFVASLEIADCITAVSFSPNRCHLMLVKYDSNRYSSQDVLASIESLKINAKLVGPV
jgi:hypothetical protein